MGSKRAPAGVGAAPGTGGGAEVTIVELAAPGAIGGGSLVATPTRVDPLLPTLAVEAEYIMRPTFGVCRKTI